MTIRYRPNVQNRTYSREIDMPFSALRRPTEFSHSLGRERSVAGTQECRGNVAAGTPGSGQEAVVVISVGSAMHHRQIAVLALLLAVPTVRCSPSEPDASTNPGRASPSGNDVQVFAADLPFEQVRSSLRETDEQAIVYAIVQMAPMKYRQDVVHLLNAAWQESRSDYPDLNWQLLAKPRVRVAMAQVLGSWERDDPQYRSFILDELNSARDMDKVETLIAFGTVAIESDIALLNTLARGPDELSATGALSGLQAADTNSARQVLTRIAGDLSVPEDRRKFAGQLLSMPRASDPGPKMVN